MLAEYLKSSWYENLGIKVHVKKSNWNIFRNKLEKGCFEITATIQDTIEEDSLEFYERSEGANSWNFPQWDHLTYRNLVANAQDPVLRKQSLALATKILNEEVPFTPLFIYSHLFAHHPKLENYSIDLEGCIDFSQASLKTQ